ncbi:hypothetical protein FOF52_06395 [Thermobifida alba]|uniref:Uncharacterized protein n=1 Tax=Thermobifida alba TaxID=53522 RepID=A0ABY4L3K7_THEAE|nr:hypothetical protein [Thermobifida alba]UPT20642.1 hypothetical protein FOF52_06395 [Thermobifida alba]
MTDDTERSTSLPAALRPLYARLRGGVLPSAQQLSTLALQGTGPIWKDLRPHLERLWALVPAGSGPRSVPLPGNDLLEEAINHFSAYFATPGERVRRQLRTLLLYPHELLDQSLDTGTGHTSRAADSEEVRVHWMRTCVTVEAVWRHVDSGADRYGELARLRPLAARNRFLALAEPMRYRAVLDSPWIPSRSSVFGATDSPTQHVFGADTYLLLVDRVRTARRDWYAYLNTYQSHPLLAQAELHQLEGELREICTARGYSTGPLILSSYSLDKIAPPDGEDEDMVWEVLHNHLLPRFRFLETISLIDPTKVVFAFPLLVSALVCGFGLAAAGMALFCHSYTTAAVLAAACYALIGLGAVRFGRVWTALWLLRLPAAATLGLVPLVAFPDWWQRIQFNWSITDVTSLAPLLLLGVSYGYLVIEARNHGVGPAQALSRAATVAAVGALHAFLVSLLGLTIIAPVFGEQTSDTNIASLWTTSGSAPVVVLVTAAAWCLAIGVFSQILWDERPITAPLAHTHWRDKQ